MFDIVSKNRTLGEDKALKKLLKTFSIENGGVGRVVIGDEEDVSRQIVHKCRERLKDKIITCNTASWFALIRMAEYGAEELLEENIDDVQSPEMQKIIRGASEFMMLLENKSQDLLQSKGLFISKNTAKSMGSLAYNIAHSILLYPAKKQEFKVDMDELLSNWGSTISEYIGADKTNIHLLDDDDIYRAISVCERLMFDENINKYGVEVW